MTVSRDELESYLARLRAECGDPRAGLFGPSSITWRIDRESALLFGGGCAALLQLAHPFVAHAVDQHSATRDDPQGRFRRTFANVYAMVFGDLEHAFASARRVHTTHTRVTGVLTESVGALAHGTPYEANHEASLFWVHATLIHTAVQVYERFVSLLSDDEKERYYGETRRMARLFGISDRAMPSSWTAFCAYFAETVLTLRVGAPAEQIARFLLRAPSPLHVPGVALYRNLTAGLLPDPLRAQYALPFGPREARLFEATVLAARLTYAAAPRSLRYVPAYLAAERRIRGLAPTAPARSKTFHRALLGAMGQQPQKNNR